MSAPATALRKLEMNYNDETRYLGIQTPHKDYSKVYEGLDQISLVHEGTDTVKLVKCKLETFETHGDVVLEECSIEKTVTAAGNVFCRECQKLGAVRAGKDLCTWNSDIEVAQGHRVFLVANKELKAAIVSHDGHVYLATMGGYKARDGRGPLSATMLSGAAIDKDLRETEERPATPDSLPDLEKVSLQGTEHLT